MATNSVWNALQDANLDNKLSCQALVPSDTSHCSAWAPSMYNAARAGGGGGGGAELALLSEGAN